MQELRTRIKNKLQAEYGNNFRLSRPLKVYENSKGHYVNLRGQRYSFSEFVCVGSVWGTPINNVEFSGFLDSLGFIEANQGTSYFSSNIIYTDYNYCYFAEVWV